MYVCMFVRVCVNIYYLKLRKIILFRDLSFKVVVIWNFLIKFLVYYLYYKLMEACFLSCGNEFVDVL